MRRFTHVISRPFDLLIVLKIPRAPAKWMGEKTQFVHQFGCWHSFSAINGVVSFSPEFLEKTMVRERERETCTRRSRKHCHGNQGQAAESFIQTCSTLFQFVPICAERLLASHHLADLDGLTAKAPRRKSRVGERHFHHTAAEGGSRWRVSLDRGNSIIQMKTPQKKKCLVRIYFCGRLLIL